MFSDVFADPRLWSENHVALWLTWASREFSLEGVSMQLFNMRGRDMCGMGKEAFLGRAPPFMEISLYHDCTDVERERIISSSVAPSAVMQDTGGGGGPPGAPPGVYDPVCHVPDLTDFLAGYPPLAEPPHNKATPVMGGGAAGAGVTAQGGGTPPPHPTPSGPLSGASSSNSGGSGRNHHGGTSPSPYLQEGQSSFLPSF
ncbi:hypothetical protein B566_EDAN009344 [Ephemera danica]|nr:hypothetical protein B566_EDAN009344 [Ephemera danica]